MNKSDRDSPLSSTPSTGQWMSLLGPVLLALCAVVAIFGLYEVIERTWLTQINPRTLLMLHLVRGLMATLVAAVIVGRLIMRSSPSLLLQVPSGIEWEQGVRFHEADRITNFTSWFILMRWIAVIVATALVFIIVRVTHLLPQSVWWPLISLVCVLAGFNLFLSVCLQRDLLRSWLIPMQVYVDLTILTLLLHFSGGIENPISLAMLFHVIIGGIILERTQGFMVAVVATALFGLLALLEWSEVVSHYTLLIFPHPHNAVGLEHAAHQGLYVTCRVSLQAIMLLLTAYFVTTLSQRLRDDERQMEHLASRALEEHQLLQQSQAQMLRAGRLAAVGELAGQVAHEVNNPIAIISAKARLLVSDQPDAMSQKVRQELGKIIDLSDRVAKIAQGLLSYCRTSTTQRIVLDVCVPIRKALVAVELAARSRSIAIRDPLSKTMPQVKANADELEQVFLNLFINAMDAMPQGGVLTVRGQVQSDDPSLLMIEVSDTGMGMETAVQERAFEPFFTSKPQGKGTGLGLSICQGLIRSHGGQITIQSQLGQGTRMIITLPIDTTIKGMEADHA